MKIYLSLSLGLFLLISTLTKAQFIDNYGFRLGIGLSNQYWNLKGMEDFSDWKTNKTGFIGQFMIEKKINNYIAFRPAIGYTQYGCILHINFNPNDPTAETPLKTNYNLDLHYLSADLSIKISPLQAKFTPYILLGFRSNYLFNYRDELEETDFGFISEYNKITLDGLFGVGISYNDFLNLDFEFNPALTKNYDNSFLSIKNRYYSLTLGLNINRLL